MESRLIDTNIVSYLLKNDSRASLYDPHLRNARLCICFMTVAELYRWAIHRKWGTKRIRELRQQIQRYVVLPYDDATAWEWAKAMSVPGRPMAVGDGWIAAAALRHAIPLVTHNRTHFEHVPGLAVISEA